MANMTGEQFFSRCLQDDAGGIPIDWKEAASRIYLAAETRMASLENELEQANIRADAIIDLVPENKSDQIAIVVLDAINKANAQKAEKIPEADS